ncbi:MAG TPA: HK97 family phage prohead protease [Patescibacteria group bacterium]|nr:HK97 family phage prohead protease [Patescibacteria group bacterium]
MNHPLLDTAFELKFLAETGVFEGYASVFGVTDSVNDRILPGAFAESLKGFSAEGRLPLLLWQHDPRQPIGVWREIREDAHGLWVKGELFIDDIPRAREAYRLLQENVVTGLSIGYRTKQSHRDGDARVLSALDLVEISMVTFPANDMARVRRVKSRLAAGETPSEKEFEAFLRDAGMSRKQAKGVMANGYKSLNPREADEAAEDDGLAAAIADLAETIRKST